MQLHLFYFLLLMILPSVNRANEEFDAIFVDGPGVLSGDKGHFTLDDLRGKKPKQEQTTAKPQNNHHEFDQFTQWRKAKAENNSEYQEFLDWQNYQAFKIRQATQKNSHKAD